MRSFILMYADRLIERTLNRRQFDEWQTLKCISDFFVRVLGPSLGLSMFLGGGFSVVLWNLVVIAYGPNIIPPLALAMGILFGGIIGGGFVGIWGTQQAERCSKFFAKRLLNRQFARAFGG